jgi:NitT/TauT family transport system substrate-binding protein
MKPRSTILKKFGYACLVGVSVLATETPAWATDQVTLALDWVVDGVHASYFVARDKGFYKDAGVDVTISRGFGSGDTIKRVASAGASFGVADIGAIVAARANDDIPVRIVAVTYDKASLGVIYQVQSGIKLPKDLEGRKLGRSASGASVNMLPGFLKANSLDRSKITEVGVDAATLAPLLASGQVDAILDQSIYVSRYASVAAQQGKTVAVMRYSDYGLATYGNAIIASPDTLKAKPDMVRRFIEASIKGMAYAFAHPDEAVAILVKANPEVDPQVAKDEMTALAEIELTPDVARNGFGSIGKERMATTEDIVVTALSLKKTVAPEDLYTTEFLPKQPILPAK